MSVGSWIITKVNRARPLRIRGIADLLRTVAKTLENPRHFPPAGVVMRRANLAEFPYHFLYQERPWGIKVTVALRLPPDSMHSPRGAADLTNCPGRLFGG